VTGPLPNLSRWEPCGKQPKHKLYESKTKAAVIKMTQYPSTPFTPAGGNKAMLRVPEDHISNETANETITIGRDAIETKDAIVIEIAVVTTINHVPAPKVDQEADIDTMTVTDVATTEEILITHQERNATSAGTTTIVTASTIVQHKEKHVMNVEQKTISRDAA